MKSRMRSVSPRTMYLYMLIAGLEVNHRFSRVFVDVLPPDCAHIAVIYACTFFHDVSHRCTLECRNKSLCFELHFTFIHPPACPSAVRPHIHPPTHASFTTHLTTCPSFVSISARTSCEQPAHTPQGHARARLRVS